MDSRITLKNIIIALVIGFVFIYVGMKEGERRNKEEAAEKINARAIAKE